MTFYYMFFVRAKPLSAGFLFLFLVMITNVLLVPTAYSKDSLLIQNFEKKKGLLSKIKNIRRMKHGRGHPGKGRYAGLWDSERNGTITFFSKEKNWSVYDSMSFLLHSEYANNQKIKLTFFSENINSDDHDFYSIDIKVDWIGWKKIEFLFSDMRKVRDPIGFNSIDRVVLRAFYPPKKADFPQVFMLDDMWVFKK